MRTETVSLAVSLALAVASWLPSSAAATGEIASRPEEIQPILIGAPVPEVTVETVEGEEIDLAAAVRSQPTVLIFYRGGW